MFATFCPTAMIVGETRVWSVINALPSSDKTTFPAPDAPRATRIHEALSVAASWGKETEVPVGAFQTSVATLLDGKIGAAKVARSRAVHVDVLERNYGNLTNEALRKNASGREDSNFHTGDHVLICLGCCDLRSGRERNFILTSRGRHRTKIDLGEKTLLLDLDCCGRCATRYFDCVSSFPCHERNMARK